MAEKENALKMIDAAKPPLWKIETLYQQMAQEEDAYDRKLHPQMNTLTRLNRWSAKALGLLMTFCLLIIVMDEIFYMKNAENVLFIAFWGTVLVYKLCKKLGKRKENFVLADLEKRKDKIKQQIQQVFQDNYELIKPLPRDYRYYQAAEFMERAFINGRADNMKEALNLFENHLHQQRVENYNRAALEQNEQIARYLAQIEANTLVTAVATASQVFNQ